MKKEKNFEFLEPPFNAWYEEKADEIYDIGEIATNCLSKNLKISNSEFYKKYIQPIAEMNLMEREVFFKALSYHLSDDYTLVPYVIKYSIKQTLDPTPNALDWLLVHVKNLNLFDFNEDLLAIYKNPIKQCLYCGKPNYYKKPPSQSIFYFDKKQKYCHDYDCNHNAGSNTNEHSKECHYYKWTRKKKTLIERLSQAKHDKAIKIFIAFCEQQLLENLKIKYIIQEQAYLDDGKENYLKECRLTDFCIDNKEENLFFNINHITPGNIRTFFDKEQKSKEFADYFKNKK